MKIETISDIPATADRIFDLLLDENYYKALEKELDKVSRIDLFEVEELPDGRIRRVVRFTAPTELPRFLRSFRDKAPDEVHWQETGIIDRAGRRMEFSIRAKAPEHWHERYENQGLLTIAEMRGGKSRITRSIDYSVDVPGLSYIIERALRGEVKTILTTQDKQIARQLS